MTTYVFLHPCELNNPLVNRALRDEAVHSDLAGLSETMSTVHSLSIVGRIPVVVVEDDRVRGSQVDTKTTGTGTQ